MMKKMFFLLMMSALFLGCKKEKFDLGVYEIQLSFKLNDKTIEHTRKYEIVSEGEDYIEVARVLSGALDDSFKLDKSGRKIKGYIGGFNGAAITIEGKRKVFEDWITGKITGSISSKPSPGQTTPNPSIEIKGIFKMTKK